MMKTTFQKILETRLWVKHIDDERSLGNSIIVTLDDGFCFMDEKGCGVRGYDTVAEVEKDTRFSNVINIKNIR
jgi:hypothetical protein